MGTVPGNAKLKMEWYEAHVAQFAANAVAIGTTTSATTDLTTKTTTARTKYDAKVAAENASKVATSEWHGAVDAMGIAGSAIIDQIRAKAKITGGTSIYDLAGIPAPATPTPVPPPGTPYRFVVTLNPDGSIQLNWKCDNPVGAPGTFYQVRRRPEGASAFDYLGGTGLREFTDATLPAGSASMIYQIQAMRSTTMGLAAEFLVKFGVSGGGPAITSVTEMTTPKMAA